jgi:hypothetical protein
VSTVLEASAVTEKSAWPTWSRQPGIWSTAATSTTVPTRRSPRRSSEIVPAVLCHLP